MGIVEADVFARLEKLLHNKVANGGPKKLAKGTKLSKVICIASIPTNGSIFASLMTKWLPRWSKSRKVWRKNVLNSMPRLS